MAVAPSMNRPTASDDLLPVLHEEIAKLPEKHRLAVVHCDLEGMTQVQAAGQLRWSRRTLQDRLAEGRARLKRRLAQRGVAPDGANVRGIPARGTGRGTSSLERGGRSSGACQFESDHVRRRRIAGF